MLTCMLLLISSAADLFPRACAASTMEASKSCIEFIKAVEGFSSQPYYDYSQHTVGYGTKCPTDKYFEYYTNGISKEEAEVLLYEAVSEIEDAINEKLIERYGLTFSQHQFDALVSFSYNLGTSWMTYDSTLRSALLRDAGEDDLIYAFSLYSTAGGNYLPTLVTRRLCEANMFLNGVYRQSISDAYGYVFYEPNGGSLTYKVQGFVCENNSAPIADASRNADVFLGWFTDLTGGSQVTKLNKSLTGKTLFARWQSAEDSEDQDSQSTIVHVTGDVVNIRKGPGTNYGISKQVYRDHVLVISHVTHLTNMMWGKVQDGWICLDYTNYNDVISGSDDAESEDSNQPSDEDTGPAHHPDWDDHEHDGSNSRDDHGVISGIVRVNDFLRVRSGPGTAYPTVGYLFNDEEVDILKQETSGSMVWGRIADGWVCMDYIVTDPLQNDRPDESGTTHGQDAVPEKEPEKKPVGTPGRIETTTIEGIISADALRIRSGPGTKNPIVGFYYQDDPVKISQKVLVDSVYWGKTDKGWIHMDYVSIDSASKESAPSDKDEVLTVIADCLRIRKGPGTAYKITGFLYDGDTVTILQTKTIDGTVWGEIGQGWICMDYVK